MAGQMDAGGRGGVLRRGLVAEAKAAILPDVRRLIEESIGRIAVRANGNLAAIGIRSALMFDPAAAAVVDDPDHEQVIIPIGAALPRCSAFGGKSGIASGAITTVDLTGAAFDPGGWLDLAANTITVPDEGDYEIHAYVGWTAEGATDPTTGTYRLLLLDLTPGYDRSRQDPPPPAIDSSLSEFSQETTLFEHLAAGTVIALKVSHDATGNMIVGAALESLYTARLTVVQLG